MHSKVKRRDNGASERASSASILPTIFVASILIPIPVAVGSFVLLPHRVLLLIVFVPLAFRLISGRAGRILAADVFMCLAALWATLSLLLTGGAAAVETAGIFVIEFLGAYILARVCIRSTADFGRVITFCLAVITVLVPLALLESVTQRPVLLDLIPYSIGPQFQHPRLGLRRAQSVFAHPILFGVFVSSFFGLFFFGLKGWRRTRGILLVALGTFVSLSTGAFISLIAQFGFVGWELIMRTLAKRWTLFAVLCGLAYLILDLFTERSPFHTLVRYGSFSARSAYNRIHIWNFGAQNVAENPLFGLGVNIENWNRAPWMNSSTDNFWLYMAMAYGLPMIAAFAGALILIIRALSQVSLQSPIDRSYRAGILTSIGGIIVAGGTVHYWHTMLAFVMFMFGVGLWLLTPKSAAGLRGALVEASEVSNADCSRDRTRPSRNRLIRKPRMDRSGSGGGTI